MNMGSKIIVAAMGAAAVFVLPACSHHYPDFVPPERSAVTTGTTTNVAEPSDVRDPVSIPPQYTNLAGTVTDAAADAAAFWEHEYLDLDISAIPYVDPADAPCKLDQTHSSAVACMGDVNRVGYYLPNMKKYVMDVGGEIGVYIVAGHETGHVGLHEFDPSTDTSSRIGELRATCAAGSFLKREAPAKGWSPEDVNTASKRYHASSTEKTTLDRLAAFKQGWDNGVWSCTDYNGR